MSQDDLHKLDDDNMTPEMLAAHALMTLHFNSQKRDNKNHVQELKVVLEKQETQVKNVISVCMNTIKQMKSTNTKYLNQQPVCTVEVPSPPHRSSSEDSETLEEDLALNKITRYTANIRTEPMKNMTSNRNMVLGVPQTPCSSRPMIGSNSVYRKQNKMVDKAIQTDPTNYNPDAEKIAKLEATAKTLYKRFLILIEQVEKKELRQSTSGESYETDSSVLDRTEQHSPQESEVKTSETELASSDKDQAGTKKSGVRRAPAHTTNSGLLNPPDVDMVPIGIGNAMVPSTLMDVIDWSSHTTATRQLLQAVFPRSTLATHSLTGKQSPAFANKPAKKRLDPELVDDIVDTVSDRCGVSKRIVRSCITTKCTDEAKLYRNRLQHRQSNDSRCDQENYNNMSSSPPGGSFPNESIKKE